MSRAGDPAGAALGLLRAGRAMEAKWLLEEALRRQPRDAGVHNAMAVVLGSTGDAAGALAHAQQAAKLRPGNHEYLTNLGQLLVMSGQAAAAVPMFEKALAIRPGFPTRVGFGNALVRLRRFDAAAEQFRRAAALNPADEINCSNAVLVTLKSGRPDQAVRLASDAVRNHPASLRLAIAAAFVSNYGSASTPASVFEAHRRVGELLAHRGDAAPAGHTGARDPEQRLRVGLLSGDLRRHPVATFIEPLLDRRDPSMRIDCYSTASEEDEVTARLQGKSDGWRRVAGMEDAALAHQIRADGVHLLIETIGLTGGQRLGALALKPAPLLLTWCGYPATTGLTAVDFRIVDSQTDPTGADAFAAEHLIRLDPCFLCFVPPAEAGESLDDPAEPARPYTFASFNALAKVNDRVLDLWSRVLAAAPASHLLVKSLESGEKAVEERLRGAFVARGIEGERVHIAPPVASGEEHLATYLRADAALDPFPYNGTTTTCEALWMGVPVVTLAGAMHAGRVGVSLLSAAGQKGLIAASEEEYLRLAVDLAGRGFQSTAQRQELRAQLRASPLMDADAYAARFWKALRACWRAHCSAPV